LANIFKPDINLNKTPDKIYSPKKGIRIVPYGWTKDTEQFREGGNNAVRDYLFNLNVTKLTVGYGRNIDNLKRLGYQPGLTM